MKTTTRLTLAASLLIGLTGVNAHASSPEAWSEFAKTVETKCLEAAEGLFRKPRIVVDPIGSEKYGIAVLFGRSKGAKTRASIICIVDKQTQAVELGSELGEDKLRMRMPRPLGPDGKPLPPKNQQQDAQSQSGASQPETTDEDEDENTDAQ
ncbi:hypothetical protein [Rhizobium alvei]|uniref:Uncharacterized protein n=1 Tax=Rhizobium alvei TaxID=1132659 RepID=A0ABT8YIE4_9HYPH|nr:hypothetical protein [Rhizobium alvei]MDO6963469.1 hypothetical protein [Rhizobium alvei]